MIAKALEVMITISISFKDFDFVVTAFGKAICNTCKKELSMADSQVLIVLSVMHFVASISAKSKHVVIFVKINKLCKFDYATKQK